MVSCFDELNQIESGHILPCKVVHVSLDDCLHAEFVFLAVKTEHFFDFAQAKVETLCYELEKDVGEYEGKGQDHESAH